MGTGCLSSARPIACACWPSGASTRVAPKNAKCPLRVPVCRSSVPRPVQYGFRFVASKWARRERETGTGLLHVDAHPTPIGVHLHANFRTAKHQHDALLVSQSRPANASPEGSANAQSSVAPREIAWSAKVGGTTSKFARRNAECGTKARARRFKGILFTVKCQNASASSSSGDEPSFAEDYPQRTGICLRRSSGCTPKD